MNDTCISGVVYKSDQLATEAHGKTTMNKCLSVNISVCFRGNVIK
jgi:hypothetical protein